MDTRRMKTLLDVLHVLSDQCESYEDACAVIEALDHMRIFKHLRALWRPNEMPATTRRDLAEGVADDTP